MALNTDSLTFEQKVIQVVGKYRKDNPSREGMPPRDLEDMVGLELSELRSILKKLLKDRLIEAVNLGESRPDYRIWHQLPANVEQEQVKVTYEGNFRFRLTPEGHTIYNQLPKLTNQGKSPLDRLKHPILCTTVAGIVRELSHNIAAKLKRRHYLVVKVARKNYCEVDDAIILYPHKRAALEKNKKTEDLE